MVVGSGSLVGLLRACRWWGYGIELRPWHGWTGRRCHGVVGLVRRGDRVLRLAGRWRYHLVVGWDSKLPVRMDQVWIGETLPVGLLAAEVRLVQLGPAVLVREMRSRQAPQGVAR